MVVGAGWEASMRAVTDYILMGRTEQVIQFVGKVPWPLPARDAILQTLACDDIDDLYPEECSFYDPMHGSTCRRKMCPICDT